MNTTKTEEKKSGMGSTAAIITGAVIGAGVVAAGAIAMSDKHNREKVKEVFTEARDKTVDAVESLQNKAQGKMDKIITRLADDKEKVIDAANTKIDLMQNQVK